MVPKESPIPRPWSRCRFKALLASDAHRRGETPQHNTITHTRVTSFRLRCKIDVQRVRPQVRWPCSAHIVSGRAYAPTPVACCGPPFVLSTTPCPGRKHSTNILSKNQMLNPAIRGSEGKSDLMTARPIPPISQLREIVCPVRDIRSGFSTVVAARDWAQGGPVTCRRMICEDPPDSCA